MHTNDSQPPAGASSASKVTVTRFAVQAAAALRGRRDRTADRRVWPYALAPFVLAAADAALNGPAVLAQDVTMLTAGTLDAVHTALRVVVEAVTVR